MARIVLILRLAARRFAMTVDLLAATFPWPEGALLDVREGLAFENGADASRAEQVAGPHLALPGETFWATVLRQMGWPLPPRPATPS